MLLQIVASQCYLVLYNTRYYICVNPSTYKGKDLPVISIFWEEIADFLAKLNQMDPR